MLRALDEGKTPRQSSRGWPNRHLSAPTAARGAAVSPPNTNINPAMPVVLNSSTPWAYGAFSAPMAAKAATSVATALAATTPRVSSTPQQAPRKRPYSEIREEANPSPDATEPSPTVLLYVPREGEDDFADVAFSGRNWRQRSALNPHGFLPAKQWELLGMPPMKRQAEMRKLFIMRRKSRIWRERQRSHQDIDSDGNIDTDCDYEH